MAELKSITAWLSPATNELYSKQQLKPLNSVKRGLIKVLGKAYDTLAGPDLQVTSAISRPYDYDTRVGSAKASPTIDRYNRLFYEPAEYRALISQLQNLLTDHPILRAGVNKFAKGAVSADFTVVVKSAPGGEYQRRQAQQSINSLKKRLKLKSMLPQISFNLVAFGNDYLQPVMNLQRKITQVASMPIASMIRLSDDRDEFIDDTRHFVQIDTATTQEGHPFAKGQILHARHNHTPGHRYGLSDLFSCRGTAKDSIDALRSLLPRRLANQPFRIFDIDPLNTGSITDSQFKEFIAETSRKVAMLQGDEYSPFEDAFVNGVKVEVKGGDPQLGTVDDIEMLLDATLSVLGVSRQLLGSGVNVNRDILDEQREEMYLAQSQLATTTICDQVLMPLFELQLALDGMSEADLADLVIEIEFGQSLPYTVLQKRIENARKDYILGGISSDTYVRLCSTYYGFDNVEIEKEKIQQDLINKARLNPNFTAAASGGTEQDYGKGISAPPDASQSNGTNAKGGKGVPAGQFGRGANNVGSGGNKGAGRPEDKVPSLNNLLRDSYSSEQEFDEHLEDIYQSYAGNDDIYDFNEENHPIYNLTQDLDEFLEV